MTALRLLLSASVKPKSEAAKVWELSSVIVMVLSVPAGASLTAVTAVTAVERLRVAAEISVVFPLVETSTVEASARSGPLPSKPAVKAGAAEVPVLLK